FSNFQKNKRIILRLVGQELLEMIEEVRTGQVRKTRESFFGSDVSEPYEIFSNPLIFTEEGKDDYLYMEQYVMLGNFQRDPDRFEVVEQEVREFVAWADGLSPEAREYRVHREMYEEQLAQLAALRPQPEEATVSRRLFGRPGRVPGSILPTAET